MEDPMISRTPLDDAYERCQADNDALRERAERAESERDAVQACYDKQLTATKEQRLRACAAEAENTRMREAMEDIANMPEHDQDDSHRLRHKARAALRPADAGDGVG